MLKLTKKGDKYWLFEDSEIGLFSPSKFTINLLNNDITIVYENGLKSKTYNVIDGEIYDLGSLVPFTTSSGNDFMAKLEELNCPCFQKNENIYYISGGSWSELTDFDLLPDATTPLAGTEEIPIVQSGVTKKVAVSEIGGGITPDLQQVTDIGNVTTNSIIVQSINEFTEISPATFYLANQTTNRSTSFNTETIQNTDDVSGFSCNILFRTRTKVTDFYFEDEGGNKSIATREWVNANNYRKWLVKDTTPTTAVTGTTSITQIGSSILIPANTFSAEDVMVLEGFGLDRLTTFGTVAFRLFHNTTNSLTGATVLSVSLMSQYNITALARKTFEIGGGLLKCRFGIGSSAFFDYAGANLPPLSVSFNPAIDNYFFTTVQLSNASDSVTRTQLLISK